jgi:hypothetical protein
MLRRLTAAWATKNRSRAMPFVQFFSATFLRLLECFAFLYRNRKNVIYSRNVMCHFSEYFEKIMKYIDKKIK